MTSPASRRHPHLGVLCVLILFAGSAGIFFSLRKSESSRAAATATTAALQSLPDATAPQRTLEDHPSHAPDMKGDPQKHGREKTGNLDRREPLTAGPSAARLAALDGLRRRVPGVDVQFDSITGSPSHVMATGRFLTGSAPVAAPANGDFHEPVRRFIGENEALFGHGAGALQGTRITREDVAAHNGMRTVVWQQQVDAIPIHHAILRASLTKNGELITIGSHFIGEPEAATHLAPAARARLIAQPPLDVAKAISLAAAHLGDTVKPEDTRALSDPAGAERRQRFSAPRLSDTNAGLAWLPMSASSLQLAWDVTLMSLARREMFRVLVDVKTGEVLMRTSLTNDISAASYRVHAHGANFKPFDSPTPFSPGHNTPSAVQPAEAARNLVTLPALDTNASPNGWIDDGSTATYGNNVDAHLDLSGTNPTFGTGIHADSATRVFDFPMNLTQSPGNYQSAAVTALFYICNWYHDRLYALGFTESAGNFQQNNFARGGAGSDAVLADAQDGGGTNNANFSTPPDGSPGRMQMYVFTGPSPARDGDLDAEIVIHEATHGLSNRLVGGGVGITALQPGGMGEGWSDFYAIALLTEPADDVNGNYAAGGYVTKNFLGQTANFYYGIRRYPYSTDLTKNPLTLKDIDPTKASAHNGVPRSPVLPNTANTVHNMGEVWCVTLWDVRANLIAKHGWAIGNELVLQLVTDGMKLSPANPTFLQARDAIVQADRVNNSGANRLELWMAFAKRGMGASASVPPSFTATGVVEAFDLPPPLGVTPTTTITITGPTGGPFTPPSATYTLANTSDTPLTWTAAPSHPWLAISPSGGTLAGGGTTTVTIAFTNAATSLTGGLYSGTVTFSDFTNSQQSARAVTLVVGGPDYFTELFDTSANDTDNQSWLFTPDGSPGFYGVQRTAALSFPTDPAGGTKVTLTDDSNALATLGGGAQFSFYGVSRPSFYIGSNGYITFGTGDVSYSADLASHFAKPRIAALFDDLHPGTQGTVSWRQLPDRAAITWQNVPQYGTNDSNHCQIEIFFDGRIRITCLAVASTDGLIGLSAGSGVQANFVESDFSTYGSSIPSLRLAVPATVREGDGVLVARGTVSIPSAQPAPVVATLFSTNTSKLLVPSAVTIPAGQLSATFDLTVSENELIDGTQNVILSASAPGFANAVRVIPVQDNETPPTLAVSAPAMVSEGAGQTQGTVTLSVAPAGTILVGLTSSDTTAIQVPAIVAIPPGQAAVPFPITVVNDTKIDGTQTATITAHVAAWQDATASIAVQDDEGASMVINVPTQIIEGVSINATASISGTLTSAITISLASNDPERLAVPDAVTIPAGSTSAGFTLSAPDNTLPDGSASLSITASAPGFPTATASTTVFDNDAHHFAVSAIASPQTRGAPFGITISALDVDENIVASFVGAPTISANGSAGSVTISPGDAGGFVGGTWSGNVTAHTFSDNTAITISDSANHTGTSNAFDVAIGPLDHFAWSPIAGAQAVNNPFAATITAQDAGNNAVTAFSGTVNLGGVTTVKGASRIAITEINPNTPDEVEFMNVSPTAVDVSGWQIHLYDEDAAWPAPKAVFTIPQGTVCAAGQVFRLQEFGTAPGTFPQFFFGGNINWTSDASSHVAVLLRDASGTLVDFAAAASATPSAILSPTPIPTSQWTGQTIAAPTNTTFAYARIGGSDRNLAADWTTAISSIGAANPGLTPPFPAPSPVPIAPAVSANFVDGVWTGSVTIQQPALQMRLSADDGAGHTGESSLVDAFIPQPTIGSVAAVNIGPTTATLTAIITAGGNATAARFQSGTSVAYGTDTTVTLLPNDGLEAQAVSVEIGGLLPGATVHFRATATNAGGTTNTPDVVFTTISNDAALAKLAIDPGTIAPAFSNATTTYSASVPNATTSVALTVTAANDYASAEARINDAPLGSTGNPLALNVGPNTAMVVVTAQDGITTKVYTTLVTRRTKYEDWTTNHGLSGPNSTLTADFDRDGAANLLEWAFGTSPTLASTATLAANGSAIIRRGAPTTLSTNNGAGGITRVAAFARRADFAAIGMTYSVQFSADLASWATAFDDPTVLASDGEIEIVTIPFPPPVSGVKANFFHVTVTAP